MSLNDIASYTCVLFLMGLAFYAIFRIIKQDYQTHNK